MPHVTLEYTDNLSAFDARAALVAINRTLAATGHFDEVDIKSRAVVLQNYVTGVAESPRAFVHARLAMLSGRSADIKRRLSQAVLAVLHDSCKQPDGMHLQLCAEIVDIDRDSYAKSSLR